MVIILLMNFVAMKVICFVSVVIFAAAARAFVTDLTPVLGLVKHELRDNSYDKDKGSVYCLHDCPDYPLMRCHRLHIQSPGHTHNTNYCPRTDGKPADRVGIYKMFNNSCAMYEEFCYLYNTAKVYYPLTCRWSELAVNSDYCKTESFNKTQHTTAKTLTDLPPVLGLEKHKLFDNWYDNDKAGRINCKQGCQDLPIERCGRLENPSSGHTLDSKYCLRTDGKPADPVGMYKMFNSSCGAYEESCYLYNTDKEYYPMTCRWEVWGVHYDDCKSYTAKPLTELTPVLGLVKYELHDNWHATKDKTGLNCNFGCQDLPIPTCGVLEIPSSGHWHNKSYCPRTDGKPADPVGMYKMFIRSCAMYEESCYLYNTAKVYYPWTCRWHPLAKIYCS